MWAGKRFLYPIGGYVVTPYTGYQAPIHSTFGSSLPDAAIWREDPLVPGCVPCSKSSTMLLAETARRGLEMSWYWWDRRYEAQDSTVIVMLDDWDSLTGTIDSSSATWTWWLPSYPRDAWCCTRDKIVWGRRSTPLGGSSRFPPLCIFSTFFVATVGGGRP